MKKNRRLVIVFSVICIIVFFSLFSSQIFKLKEVEISFYDENEKHINNIQSNLFFNTNEKINKIISSTKFDYGSLVFLINKNSYYSALENNNPYLKLKNIEVKFPNKLVVNVSERKAIFYIKNENSYYLLDNEFKLLEISKNKSQIEHLTEINIISTQGETLNFFNFFDVLPLSFEAGQSLKENIKIFSIVENLANTLQNYAKQNKLTLSGFAKEVSFTEANNTIKLTIKTCSPLGLNLVLENIFSNFNYKLNKLLNALNTLKIKEPIKTTYGVLKIDNASNCYWNIL